MRLATLVAAFMASALMSGSLASASVLTYVSTLTDDQEAPAPTGSSAIGEAILTLDTVAETLAVDLTVTGISVDGLWETLVAAPVGPIHLHNAPVGVNGPIAVPFPFGGTYSDTAAGFDLNVPTTSYSTLASIAGSPLSFSQFLAELDAGNIYFNVHTDAFNGGEIRGLVTPVPVPAAGILLLSGLVGISIASRRRKAAA